MNFKLPVTNKKRTMIIIAVIIFIIIYFVFVSFSFQKIKQSQKKQRIRQLLPINNQMIQNKNKTQQP